MNVEKLKTAIIELIKEETGISIQERDFEIYISGEEISLAIDSKNINTVIFDDEEADEDYIEDIAYDLTEDFVKIRRILVEARRDELENYCSQYNKEIMAIIVKKIGEENAAEIRLSVITDDMPQNHYNTEAEDSYDYPPMYFCIDDYDSFEFGYPLDVYCPEKPFEYKDFMKELYMYLESK